jgi:heterotetrameric sarcosine oxidase delta subunit
MRIRCPFCDERDSSEFTVVGDAGYRRPDPELPDAHQRFLEAVYLRDNPAGRHVELWYHGFGCRSWLQVTRDTVTHEVFAVEFVKDARSHERL